MKWWGILLLVLLVCALIGAAFWLGRVHFPSVSVAAPTKEDVTSAKKLAQKTKKGQLKSEGKKALEGDKGAASEASDDKTKEGGAKKEKEEPMQPTLPRLKRYLKPVKSQDVFSQRYALIHSSPSWRAQTGYGPPADVYDSMFSKDIFLGQQDVAHKRAVAKIGKAYKKRYQVEFSVFSSYQKAVALFKKLTQKIRDSIVICDNVDHSGRVRYSVRLRAPMDFVQAQDYITYCVEVADVVAHVVPYSF